MLRRLALFGLLFGLTAFAAGAAPGERVAYVIDGDTLALDAGQHVRLVQIDTPEVGSGECYSRAAAKALRRLVPAGSAVALEADPRLDRVDRYGRLLRYIWSGPTNVNVELVREGAATVWFYGGVRGKYAARLLAAAREARSAGRGLWGACRTVWNPNGPATTSPRTSTPGKSTTPPSRERCDAAYPTVCIASPHRISIAPTSRTAASRCCRRTRTVSTATTTDRLRARLTRTVERA